MENETGPSADIVSVEVQQKILPFLERILHLDLSYQYAGLDRPGSRTYRIAQNRKRKPSKSKKSKMFEDLFFLNLIVCYKK